MNWFYATKDQTQAGPVDDAALASLLASGTITNETLIWKQGMASWTPYAAIFNPPPQGGSNATRCAECGQAFPPDQLIMLAGRPICAACKPVALQKFQEGVVSFGNPVDAEELWRKVEQRGFDFSIGSVLSRSWNMVKGNFWPCLGVTLLAYLIMMGASQIPILGLVAVFLVQSQMMAGLGWYFVKQFRGEPATLNDSFEGFRRGFGQQALYMLIMMGIFMGVIFVIAIIAAITIPLLSKGGGSGNESMLIGIFVVVMIPVILAMWYLVLCWIFTPLLILEKGLKATAAMKLSRRVVHLRFWKLLGFFIVLGLISLASLLALIIGMFFVLPVLFAAMARLYEDAFGEQGPVA
jgi:hypothetical protein